MKNIKELMEQWSKETLQEEQFAQLRSPDWPEYVRTSKGAWGNIHGRFIHTVYEKYHLFRKELQKTSGGRKQLRELLDITNREAHPELWD